MRPCGLSLPPNRSGEFPRKRLSSTRINTIRCSWVRVDGRGYPPGRTSRSTAQPVAWGPPLCRRTRPHYFFRHLLSLVNPLLPASGSFPWQTFTMSFPLQEGVRLLRCLRPLFHTLACSRPFVGVKWLESSPVPVGKLIVPGSCLLYAGWIGDNMYTQCRNGTPPTVPFGPGVTTTFTCC